MKKTDKEPLPRSVVFPQSVVEPLLPIIKSLAENDNIRDVTITQRKWTQKELTALIRCLATPQKNLPRFYLPIHFNPILSKY